MNNMGTIRLETPRLILRRFVISDVENMYKNWASDSEVTKYLTWSVHTSIDITKDFIRYCIENYARIDFYSWVIEIKNTHEIVGSISVVSIKECVNKVELGYCIGKNWWGLGITPEAGNAVIKFLFEEVGVNRIAAAHDKNNPKSGRVMQKLGMTYEGTFRKNGYNNQGICDEIWYAILKEDYMH